MRLLLQGCCWAAVACCHSADVVEAAAAGLLWETCCRIVGAAGLLQGCCKAPAAAVWLLYGCCRTVAAAVTLLPVAAGLLLLRRGGVTAEGLPQRCRSAADLENPDFLISLKCKENL